MYFGFDAITIQYGKKTVLRDFTLSIPRGKVVMLIGQNGCGKSSLLRTVVRAVTPTSGCVRYEKKPLDAYSPKQLAQKIAYLPQVHASLPDVDVRTLVSYGRYPYRQPFRRLTQKDEEEITCAIRTVGLERLEERALSTLSGGERQRAWIAMAITQNPEILILDEPTTYLDLGYQIEVLELVRRLNREAGMTILTVLHDLNLAARYADWLCVLHEARAWAFGTPETVLTVRMLREIFGVEARIFHDDTHDCPFFIPSLSIGRSLEDEKRSRDER